MPKRAPEVYKQPSIVSGKSVKDILNMSIEDFNKLNTKDMQRVVGRLVSAGNKRIRRIEQSGHKSTPVTKLLESGGVLSTQGKNLNQLRSEFLRAKNFLEDERSSVRGNNKFRNKVITELKDKHGVNITDSQFDTFFEIYEKIKEIDPRATMHAIKYGLFGVIQEEIAKKDPNGNLEQPDIDEIATRLSQNVTEIYEERERRNEYTGVSGMFDID